MVREEAIVGHVAKISSVCSLYLPLGVVARVALLTASFASFIAAHCKDIGYFNHIFKLSQLNQCGQGMLRNRFS